MGWSCTKGANDTLDFVMDRIHSKGTSNSWIYKDKKYFYELGKEHNDGVITCTIYHVARENNKCYRKGSIRIEANGYLVRWSYIPPGIRKMARKL